MSRTLPYRLITGKDDSTFCERISRLLEDGYELYGSPAVTYNGKDVIAAQAVIKPGLLIPAEKSENGKTSLDRTHPRR